MQSTKKKFVAKHPSERTKRGNITGPNAKARYAIEDEMLKLYRNCKKSFPFFTKTSLKIRDKEGGIVPLELNEAQFLIHKAVTKQLTDTGKVRAVILKGRQQGVSTYVQARFMWKLLHHKGLRAFILTHLADSTQALFSMAKRYLEHLPAYKPELGKCNHNELYFSDADCGLKVGTAGSTGVGRGETLQLVHGSEVAYWPNSEEHFAGILQAVPNAINTEIMLESTANQTGNVFHRMVMQAMEPDNEWQLIFIPWHIQKEYALPVKNKLSLTRDEASMVERYNLSIEQINWRRQKIEELGDERKFKQEYPTTIEDAFIVDTDKSFIMSSEIDKANIPSKPIETDKDAAMIIGIDPAGKGKDDSAFAIRCGRILEKCGVFPEITDTMELVGAISHLINQYKPDKVFIDAGGLGAPIYDRLRERGFRMVQAVNFQERPEDTEKYANKRAEMYDRLKRWFNAPPCQIPDSDELRMELALTQWGTNSSGKLLLAPKKDLIKSPNLADAFALTFAYNVFNNYAQSRLPNINPDITWNPYTHAAWN